MGSFGDCRHRGPNLRVAADSVAPKCPDRLGAPAGAEPDGGRSRTPVAGISGAGLRAADRRIVQSAGGGVRSSRRFAPGVSRGVSPGRRDRGNRALRLRPDHSPVDRPGEIGESPQSRGICEIIEATADVAKLADAPDLGSGSRKGVKVQVLSSAPTLKKS